MNISFFLNNVRIWMLFLFLKSMLIVINLNIIWWIFIHKCFFRSVTRCSDRRVIHLFRLSKSMTVIQESANPLLHFLFFNFDSGFETQLAGWHSLIFKKSIQEGFPICIFGRQFLIVLWQYMSAHPFTEWIKNTYE